jgi:hypothetical protein
VLVGAVACGAASAVASLGAWPEGPTPRNVVVLAAAIGVAVALYGGLALLLKLSGTAAIRDKLLRRLRRRRPG